MEENREIEKADSAGNPGKDERLGSAPLGKLIAEMAVPAVETLAIKDAREKLVALRHQIM